MCRQLQIPKRAFTAHGAAFIGPVDEIHIGRHLTESSLSLDQQVVESETSLSITAIVTIAILLHAWLHGLGDVVYEVTLALCCPLLRMALYFLESFNLGIEGRGQRAHQGFNVTDLMLNGQDGDAFRNAVVNQKVFAGRHHQKWS